MTILVIDSERESIYKNQIIKDETFYETMRDEFIKVALENEYNVIDMKDVFKSDYLINKTRTI